MVISDAELLPPRERPWWLEREMLLILLLVLASYFARLTTLPLRGEESRWANGAIAMIETGDWIVPRQQGMLFIDRPPLHSWLMGGLGLIRGKVDVIAIRLPSAVAILLTCWLIYGYGRTFLDRTGALAAAVVYATMGQVLQIGRLGENEAIFALLVSGSLLLWHWNYAQGRPLTAWGVGGALAALGALQKGIQAPIYFAAVTVALLALRRDWKSLFSWRPAAGLISFATVLAVWEIPFYRATDLPTTLQVWSATAAHRLGVKGLAQHLVTYPLETLGCLLPWSPLLVALIDPRVRRSLGKLPDQFAFLVTAIVVTYPSVLLAANARGRYFMPLYPCIALLIGLLIERCAAADPLSPARVLWRRFLWAMAIIMPGVSLVLLVASFLQPSPLWQLSQPPLLAIALLLAALVAAWVLFWARNNQQPRATRIAALALGLYLGLFYAGAVVNAQFKTSRDLRSEVARVKRLLPPETRLVSFGPANHQFVYHFDAGIPEVPWPLTTQELSDDVEYFCFTRHPGDTAEVRSSGRSLQWTTTPGTLPFEWEEVAEVACVGGLQEKPPYSKMIVGRVIRHGGRTADKQAPNNGHH